MLARQVSLLAIELQLCARRPEKALSFVTYLENQMNVANLANVKLDKGSKPADLKEKKVSVLKLAFFNQILMFGISVNVLLSIQMNS